MSCELCNSSGECLLMAPDSDYFDESAEPTNQYDGMCMDADNETCSDYIEEDNEWI